MLDGGVSEEILEVLMLEEGGVREEELLANEAFCELLPEDGGCRELEKLVEELLDDGVEEERLEELVIPHAAPPHCNGVPDPISLHTPLRQSITVQFLTH